MTVIRRTVHSYTNPSSNNPSDTESLHLGSTYSSDTESLDEEPSTTTRVRRRPVNIFGVFKLDESVSLRTKNLGKRKQRRYINKNILQTLCEEDESENYVKLVDEHKSPLTRLLEDELALEFWNDFIMKSEEEQGELIESLENEHKQNINQRTIAEPYIRISSKIKRMIKIKKTLPEDLLDKIEHELVEYFTFSPDGVYVSIPATSFERLLLHGIAQYHNLRSLSKTSESHRNDQMTEENVQEVCVINWHKISNFRKIKGEDSSKKDYERILEEGIIINGVRSVEVCNPNQDWTPCSLPFCKFVEKLRS